VATTGDRTFKDALVDHSGPQWRGKEPEAATGIGDSGSEVVWEVEVEPDALAKLKGAYVGFLSEDRDFISIQRSFVMDGYHHIKITPLGFLARWKGR
jgi:hypothetical protein